MARAIWPQNLFRGVVFMACVAFFVPKDGQTHAWSLTSWASKKSPGQLGAPIQGGAFQAERWRRLRGIQRRQASDLDEASEAEAKATVMSTTVSLAKGMLGSGALSLSAGAAAFTQSSQGLLVATVIIISMTMLSGYTFQMVAESSADTGAADFGNTWAASVGESSAWLPRLAVGIMSFTTCTVYAMILADLTSSILQTCLATVPMLGALKPFCARTPTLIGLTCFILLPLCLAEDFSSLAFTSTLGLAACAYLALFSIWRALDGSYLPGGKFFKLAPYQPSPLMGASKLDDIVNPRALIFLSNISTAYMNHGMAPATFQELIRGSSGTSSQGLRRYAMAVLGAFALAGFVCTALMVAGLYTFGGNVNGLLLSNYAGTDLAAALGKMGVLLSVLFGFPLNFLLLRNEAAAILSRGRDPLDANQRRLLSTGLLMATSAPAIVLKDIGVVQAVLGSIFGSYLVFIAPAAMSRSLRNQKGLVRRRRATLEVVLTLCGIIIGLLGLYVNLRR